MTSHQRTAEYLLKTVKISFLSDLLFVMSVPDFEKGPVESH